MNIDVGCLCFVGGGERNIAGEERAARACAIPFAASSPVQRGSGGKLPLGFDIFIKLVSLSVKVGKVAIVCRKS